MKSPLRQFVIYAVVHLCLCACNVQAFPENASDTPEASISPPSQVVIPGPMRSFLRMAGISQKASPEDVLPLLARNVYLRGYENGIETEYLILLDRYIHQARELQALASSNGTIHIANCNDATPLLQILGYQLRQGCGQKNSFLVTANPERAFLTIDSGFPLTALEEALQKDSPFTYPFPVTQVPVLFHESDWIATSTWKKRGGNLVDVLIHDASLARLYSALAKNDDETKNALLRSPGLKKLLPYSAVLDFYGSQIAIRSGRVLVPGGANAEKGWKDLVGASPESTGDFVTHLVAKDGGWLAVYFDDLSRVSQTQQQRLTEPARLKHLYEAFRTPGIEPSATKGVFRKGSDLLVLFTRLEWNPDGTPYTPGSLEVWKEILNQKTDSKIVRDWARRSRNWNSSEQLLEALVACSRIETDNGPLQIYLMMSELDQIRPPDKQLTDPTIRLLASKFPQFNNWYLIFSEFPSLNDGSITSFINVAEGIDKISNLGLRGNALGSFQANIGLWQILARQREIPASAMNSSWLGVVEPFAKVTSSVQLFDSAHSSIQSLVLAAAGKPGDSQEQIIDLLAGPPQENPEGRRIHDELAGKIRSVMDDQRLASLDTLFALGDGLSRSAQGKSDTDRLLALAGQLKEFELPRPIFTRSEKIEWSPVVYSSRHAELQVRTDLTKVIKSPASPAQLEAARGQLAPFLRDTLVGLNYAYYEPPGAQVLHNNPLFVRSHDFSGITIVGAERLWGEPDLIGVGTPAGGGAYLMGSLADLPYALATTEEDFISPENVQALIWKELVPDLLVNATLPRWWGVSPHELHAVTLYQKFGEELLSASAENTELRNRVLDILADRMTPQRQEVIEQAIRRTESAGTVNSQILPADSFYLAAEFRKRFPAEAASFGQAGKELEELSRNYPSDTNPEELSRDFGVAHPTLTRTYTRELLNVKPLPAFGGYCYRLFGESWESSNLYWARLADEMGYSPVMLNRLVPELTRRMTSKIFATDLEDWPAVLRAMQETGEEFRQGKMNALQAVNTTSPN